MRWIRAPVDKAEDIRCWSNRRVGTPYMAWDCTLKNALKALGISTDFEEWAALANNHNEWKRCTHSPARKLPTRATQALTHTTNQPSTFSNSEKQPQTQKPCRGSSG